MVALKEISLPTLNQADSNERLDSWSTSKNIGILILTLTILIVVSSICIHYVLTPRYSPEIHQKSLR